MILPFLTGIMLVVVLSACQSQVAVSPTLTQVNPTMTQPPLKPFRVVGYVSTSVDVESIQYDKLTHINYAFLLPIPDGNFEPVTNSWKLDQIVKDAMVHGVKVLISVGGWGYDAEFEALAANPESRSVFIENLVAFVKDHQVDGIDVDWEYPGKDSSQFFLALIQELREALPSNLLLTAAVASHGLNGEGIPAASFQYFDFINVMAYDGFEHASLNHAQNALDYWLTRGVPKSKVVLGVPFYSRPLPIPYKVLVQMDPDAAFVDEVIFEGTKITYNGIPSIQMKTEIAMRRASGIMIWNLEYDSLDEDTSLLNAINKKITQKE